MMFKSAWKKKERNGREFKLLGSSTVALCLGLGIVGQNVWQDNGETSLYFVLRSTLRGEMACGMKLVSRIICLPL